MQIKSDKTHALIFIDLKILILGPFWQRTFKTKFSPKKVF